jgi:hypothetical protein
LCQSKDALLDFGLPRERVLELLPRLGRDQSRGERKLNLVRRRAGYWLLLPDHQAAVDLTASLGDISWISRGAARDAATSRQRTYTPDRPEPTPDHVEPPDALFPRSFFARVRAGRLEPLDPLGLPDGTFVRVHATVTESVPQSAALRQIVAAGGPAGLPNDFAERHDHYAHGTRK